MDEARISPHRHEAEGDCPGCGQWSLFGVSVDESKPDELIIDCPLCPLILGVQINVEVAI